jgi:hypothetical protein
LLFFYLMQQSHPHTPDRAEETGVINRTVDSRNGNESRKGGDS